MELPERDVASSWLGLPVEDLAGGRVGTCTAVYADDATDRPEWALVQSAFDAGLRMVPLVDAHEEGGSLRLSFAADLIDTAPRMGNPDHLTQAEESELYRHYGVPFSAGPSDSLLPTAAGDEAVEQTPAGSVSVPGSDADEGLDTATMPPMEPEPAPTPEPLVPSPMPEPLVPAPVPQPLQPPPAPEPPLPSSPAEPPPPSPPAPRAPTPPPAPRPAPAPRPVPSSPPSVGGPRPAGPGLPAEGIVAGVVGASTAAVLLWRERRRSVRGRSPARRGVRSTRSALSGAAGVVGGTAQALMSDLSRATGQLGDVTAGAAHGGTKAVTAATDSAKEAAAGAASSAKEAAAAVATSAKEAVTGATDNAKGAAVESRRQVRRSRRAMGRSWRRTATRATAVAGGVVGYVLGARAGERRYADIRRTASRLADRLRG